MSTGLRFAVVFLLGLSVPAMAAGTDDDVVTAHGISAFGDLKYPAGFKHFDYVNPDAPKGGLIALPDPEPRNTFNSLNPFILQGIPAGGWDLLFDTLMVRSRDEPDAYYGLVAKSITYPKDRSWATFELRPEARFSDGSPLTADDIVFTLETLATKAAPEYRAMLREVATAEALGPHKVKVTFAGPNRRELPMVVATLPILSKAYYTNQQAFTLKTLKPPLGSGPYRVDKVEPGRVIQYKRRDDYWAKDLPVNVGRHNFDTVRLEYFRDRDKDLDALKSGFFDFRVEWTAKAWATQYKFRTIKKGWVKRDTVRDHMPAGLQGLFLNTRRDKFKDIRVRKALTYAFDFERLNRTQLYSHYKRSESVFANSPLAAEGKPSEDERALLDPYRSQLPPEVFGPAFKAPESPSKGDNTKNLETAAALLKEAGYSLENGKLKGPDGKPFEITFLIDDPLMKTILGPYLKALKSLGITASTDLAAVNDYDDRVRSYDYDVISARFVTGLTPGADLRALFGSAAADQPAGANLAGIHNPVVDALIERIVEATSRKEMTTAARALDRVIMWNYYVVPEWYSPKYDVAYWNRFGMPRTEPTYFDHLTWVVRDLWWVDPKKETRLRAEYTLPQREPTTPVTP